MKNDLRISWSFLDKVSKIRANSANSGAAPMDDSLWAAPYGLPPMGCPYGQSPMGGPLWAVHLWAVPYRH